VNEKGKRQSDQREWKFPCGSRMTPMVAPPPPPPPRDDALCRDQYGGSCARVLPCIVTGMGVSPVSLLTTLVAQTTSDPAQQYRNTKMHAL
jgi:hypothetical protein